ncbi:hypothetical protein DFH08DRAFT_947805 [Mycena albidolilacea]|uniref:Protein YOP1 n=1 Tax=Mycena albidolilacea TaxID=1033008 RepID=A0AAD7F6W7_9AGAR|nr:hypothetical protein DFH08DRAFT_947805 [Mycena albidolilacea]
MALIVPILRLIMLLLNMYDTFKVLKIPRPSARNSGQPTVRALSQRKRNMKGCLAVWIVWCCFMIYERLVEGIVSLFVPFYDEVKSLALLFLIFTRARGAEPIFLHIIRPLLKPYTSTLDALSDVARMFGDIIFLILTYPLQAGLSWWHSLFARRESAAEGETNGSLYTDVQQALHSVSYQMPVQTARRRSAGPVYAAVPEHNAVPPPPYVATESPPRRVSAHEIWHPPRSAYHDEEDGPPSESPEAQRAREDTEEWRQYPPFPSAYPPTPLPASSVPLPVAPQQFSPIPEDPVQGFGQSLPSPHELPNSGSARDSSDDDNVTGIQNTSHAATTALPDDEDEEEEDDFNVTLRTPDLPRPEVLLEPDTVMAPATRSRTKSSKGPIPPPGHATLVPLPSLLSRMSSETPSLLSRISSETPSSVSSDDSGASSLVSRKRSRELVPAQVANAKPAVRRARRVVGQPIGIGISTLERMEDEDDSSAAGSSASSATSDLDDDDEGGDADGGSEPHSPFMKKRRVNAASAAPAPSRVQPRRTTRSASKEPASVVPPTTTSRRQRQAKIQVPDAAAATGERASSRRGNGAVGAAASLRAGGAGTATGKRK